MLFYFHARGKSVLACELEDQQTEQPGLLLMKTYKVPYFAVHTVTIEVYYTCFEASIVTIKTARHLSFLMTTHDHNNQLIWKWSTPSMQGTVLAKWKPYMDHLVKEASVTSHTPLTSKGKWYSLKMIHGTQSQNRLNKKAPPKAS
jgi:hypothetical protein